MRKSTLSLFFLSACLANAQNFVNGQAARAEIGQPQTFSSGQSGAASNLLGGGSGLAYANGQLWVADSNRIGSTPQNNRVIGFPTSQIPGPYVDLTTTTPFSTVCGLCGYQANVVLGQPDYASVNPGRSQVATPANGSTAEAGSMATPTAVATDGTYLAVADTDNNRVLIWNTLPTTINAAPNIVLGQTNFTSFQSPQPVNANSLRGPQGVWIQNGVLFVADTQNYRILVWKHIPTQNNQPADLVLGQSSFTSVYQPPISSTNYAPSAANLLLNPTSVTSDGTRLYIADLGNNRVLIWNTAFVNGQLNLANDQGADVVVGQPNMQTTVPNWSSDLCGAADNTAPCASTLNFPRYALSDGKRLFIADGGNDRILIFNSIPTQNGASADEVLGQVDFVSDQDTSATIDITSTLVDNTGAVDITSSPTSLAFDGTNLYVADPYNQRVLVFTPGDTALPDKSAVNWASEIIRQEGIVTFTLPSGGAINAGDTVTITIQGTNYTYTIVKNDTLDTIAQGIINVINSSNSGAGDPNVTAIFAGTGTGSVYLSSIATNLAYDSISLAASTSNTVDIIATASGSYLSAGNAGTGSAGMLVEIDGSNLSDNTTSASTSNNAILPTSLGGVEVFMDGIAAPVLSVSPGQIITEIPFTFVNGTDANAGTVGVEAFTDRNSTSIYVRTVHNNGSVTVTNATPIYIAPANPGLFNAPAYAGEVRPWPAINAYHQPGNPTSVISIDGTVTAGNTASITIASATYTYTVLSTDTLITIAEALLNMINSAPDPNVTASLGGAFQRIVLTANLPGLAGTGIAVSGTSSAGATVTVTAYSPTTCCAVAPGSLITSSNPALPGELIQVSATGLGTVQDVNGNVLTVDTGAPWYGPVVNSAVSSVSATMNGETAEVVTAGLQEGGYGIYDIQMIVPTDLSANSTTQLNVAQNAFISNTVTLPIGAGTGSSNGSSGSGSGGAAVASAQMLVNPTVLVLNAGVSSPTQSGTITISNPSGSSLSISAITITGPNASNFTFSTNCYGSVPQSCTVNVTYTPTTSVMETAQMVISENVYGTSTTVALTGVSGAVYSIANQESGRVLDVMMASTANGAQIQQYDYLGLANQQWSFVPVSGGAYVIMNMNSGKVLDMTAASTSNGTLVQQYQYLGGSNQQWILNRNGQGFYTIQNVNSGLVLDDIGGGVANGTLVQQYQAITGSPNQSWALIPMQTYSFVNLYTQKVLDVTGVSKTAGALLQEWDSTGGANQKWQLIPADGTYYTISSLNSGLVLDLVAGSTGNGTQIQQSEYSESDGQKWAFVPTSNPGYYEVVNKLSGRVLDITGASSQDGTPIQIYDYLGGPNQIWELVPNR